MEFSLFWHPSHSILPCLQNCVKNSPLHLIPQEVISNSVFLIASPLSFLSLVYVWRGVRGGWGGFVGARNTILWVYNYYFWGFNIYIFVDVVKRGVCTITDEIRRYRNDRYYIFMIIILIGQQWNSANSQGKPLFFQTTGWQINDDEWKLYSYPVSVIGAGVPVVYWRILMLCRQTG